MQCLQDAERKSCSFTFVLVVEEQDCCLLSKTAILISSVFQGSGLAFFLFYLFPLTQPGLTPREASPATALD